MTATKPDTAAVKNLVLPAITLWRPWAGLVRIGWKTIETRTHDRFRSLVGKRIAIHGAMHFDKNWKSAVLAHLLDGRRHWLDTVENIAVFSQCGVVCTAFVDDHVRLGAWHSQHALIDCSKGDRFGLLLSDIHSCDPPVLVPGKQGIWKWQVPEDYASEIAGLEGIAT